MIKSHSLQSSKDKMVKNQGRMGQNYESYGSSNTIGGSSTESIISDELNESAHYHEFFYKDVIDDDILIRSGSGNDHNDQLNMDQDALRRSETSSSIDQQEDKSSIFGMFSGIFSGGRANNRRNNHQITAMTSNSKTILFGFSDGTAMVYDLLLKRMLEQRYEISSSKITKMDVEYYQTQEKDIRATILITLANNTVKWWDYDTLNLYAKISCDYVIDFSYFESRHTPFIGLITSKGYIHVFRLDNFWTFTKVAKVRLKKQPLNFIIHKDRGIISYPENYEFFKISDCETGKFDLHTIEHTQKLKIETQKLLNKTLAENQSVPIIYLESVKAFIITKSKCSYYVD